MNLTDKEQIFGEAVMFYLTRFTQEKELQSFLFETTFNKFQSKRIIFLLTLFLHRKRQKILYLVFAGIVQVIQMVLHVFLTVLLILTLCP